MSGLLVKKPLQSIIGEAEAGHLKRVLGPWSLTAMGIGAVIGAGIFVATGEVAKTVAGPALMISYVLAGITCLLAALCYAEFAAMTPVAGSAYTYAYTTLGELLAWIIGWDLILEYAVKRGQPSPTAGRITSRAFSPSSASKFRRASRRRQFPTSMVRLTPPAR